MDNLEKIDVGSKIFKDLVFDVIIKKGITLVMSFFKLTPGGWIYDLLIKVVFYYADKAYPYLVKYIKVKDIKFENEIHQRQYELALYRLKVIAIEKGINSEEFKNERKIAHDKQANLVVFNIQYR